MKAEAKLEMILKSGVTKIDIETFFQDDIVELEEFENVVKSSLAAGKLIEVKKSEKFSRDMEESNLIEQYFQELKELETIGINDLFAILKKESLTEWDEEAILGYFLNIPAQIALAYHSRKVLFLDLIQEGTIGLLEGIRFFSHVREYDVEYILTLFAARKILDFITLQKLEVGSIEKIEEEFKALNSKKREGEFSEEEKERFIQLQHITNSQESLDVPELSKALLTLNEEQRDILASCLGLFAEKESIESIATRRELTSERAEEIFEEALESMKRYLIEHGDLNAIESIF